MKHKLPLLLSFLFVFSSLSAQFNWQHTNGPNGAALGYIYSNDTYAFFPDDYFLYRTNDGITWEKLPQGGIWPLATYNSMLVGQGGSGFAINTFQTKTLTVSHDDGETWMDGTMPPGMTSFTNLAVCSHGVYIPDREKSLLFRSQDDGLTWDTLFPGLQYGSDIWAYDERVYIANSIKVFRTDVGGNGWTSCSPPLSNQEHIYDIMVVGQHLMVATDKKLWYSHDDGTTWSFNNTPWPHFYNDLERVGNVIYACDASSGIASSDDFGSTWTGISSAPLYPSASRLASVNNTLLVSSYEEGVFRLEGSTQQLMTANDGLGSARIFQLAPAGDKVWALTGSGVYGYNKLQQAWPSTPSHLSIHGGSGLLAANGNGLICVGGMYAMLFILSKDAGQTWDSLVLPTNNWGMPQDITDLEILDNNIFTLGSGSIYRSGDYGQSWLELPSGIYNIIKFNNLYLTGNGSTIRASADEGITWTQHSTFPNGQILKLATGGDRLFAFVRVPVGNSFRYRVFTSVDGIDWKYAHDGLPDANFADNFDTGDYTSFFGVGGKYFIYLSTLGFFESLDTCKTWLPLERRPYHSVALLDSLFYAGSFGGGVIRAGVPDPFNSLASGIVYSDENNNGTPDAGEPVMPNVAVSLDAPAAWSPFYFTNTNLDGAYSLAITPNTNDTLRPLVQSSYIESINPPYYLVGNGGSNLNFGLKLTPNIHDLSIVGNYNWRPRPAAPLGMNLHYQNNGTVDQDAVVSVKLDPNLAFDYSIPPPAAIFGDSLVWSIPQLQVFGGDNLLIYTSVLPSTALGTVVKTYCRVTSAATDLTPADNLRILSDVVVAAFDPNEKRVVPADGLTPAEIAAGKELQYTIYFQNTGNATADRVRITDMLDTLLYWPSLHLVSASHAVQSFRLLPGGLLEIVFDPIMLPDSNANEVGSHGSVTFAIQRKKAFHALDIVRNEAAIYFDSNEPILTNQVFTPVKTGSVSVKVPAEKTTPDLTIFPNPAQTAFTVSVENWLSGPGLLTLQNATGQICQQRKIADLSQPVLVQTANLPSGIYVVRLADRDRSVAGRVVVHRGE